MVLQVGADAGQVLSDWDTGGCEDICWADAACLEELWCLDRASGEENLLLAKATLPIPFSLEAILTPLASRGVLPLWNSIPCATCPVANLKFPLVPCTGS